MTKTQVAIVGAGPAGLFLAHLLGRAGVDCVVLEARSRAYVEGRVRAGVLEQGTVDLIRDLGLADRLEREGIEHDGVKLRFAGSDHRIDFPSLTGGRRITVYGQQEVVKDLIKAYRGEILFETPVTAVAGLSSSGAEREPLPRERPAVTYTLPSGAEERLECDFVAGCDGFHGVSRAAVPVGALSVYERAYPFAWLGVLAEVQPFSPELVYARHEDGFALHSLRSERLSRNYVQVPADASVEEWPDERFWETFTRRMELAGGADARTGPVIEKGVAQMRSFVVEPLRHGRLFLAGDAAHIVPPTGAKGLNLAVADVCVLAAALTHHYRHGSEDELHAYSSRCLGRVWRAQHFSWWLTSLLHKHPEQDAYAARLQLAQLEYLVGSRAAMTTLAENYVGW